ncbi:MAG: hypothetical protein ABFD98_15710 [Syntrophobacteraceae bacterium]|nr:hypothetical protein [Desulfobacteraceae bacterium]
MIRIKCVSMRATISFIQCLGNQAARAPDFKGRDTDKPLYPVCQNCPQADNSLKLLLERIKSNRLPPMNGNDVKSHIRRISVCPQCGNNSRKQGKRICESCESELVEKKAAQMGVRYRMARDAIRFWDLLSERKRISLHTITKEFGFSEQTARRWVDSCSIIMPLRLVGGVVVLEEGGKRVGYPSHE